MLQRGAFCNTFDLLRVLIGLENQFAFFLRVLDRFYCIGVRSKPSSLHNCVSGVENFYLAYLYVLVVLKTSILYIA